MAALAIGYTIGGTRDAVTMGIGANLLAMVSLVGAPRLSIPLAALDAVGLGLSTFIGVATRPYP